MGGEGSMCGPTLTVSYQIPENTIGRLQRVVVNTSVDNGPRPILIDRLSTPGCSIQTKSAIGLRYETSTEGISYASSFSSRVYAERDERGLYMLYNA